MAHYNDTAALRRAFVKKGFPFYIVKGKGGDSIAINESEGDIEAAGDLLAEDLRDIAETAELKVYAFKSVPKTGLAKAKTDEALVTTYQKKTIYSTDEKVEYYKNQARGTDPALLAILQKMNDQQERIETELKAQRELITALENSEDDEEIEDAAEPNGIGAILAYPAVQQILTAFATNIGANMLTNPQPPKPRAMAGTETPEDVSAQVTEYLNTLFSKGLTVDDLRKISEMPSAKIKSLLFML